MKALLIFLTSGFVGSVSFAETLGCTQNPDTVEFNKMQGRVTSISELDCKNDDQKSFSVKLDGIKFLFRLAGERDLVTISCPGVKTDQLKGEYYGVAVSCTLGIGLCAGYFNDGTGKECVLTGFTVGAGADFVQGTLTID